MMATPFVPVPVPMERTQSENCRSWPKRTSPLGSLSSSSASFPTAKSPWVRATGSLGATVVCPSLPQPCSSPEVCRRPREAEKSSVLEDGTPRDILEERPLTPILLGYEVMEERAKFTVYKILVRRSQDQEDSWVIFRRYTDFSRLNDKLKEMFPRFRLALPPKRWFKDNYDMEFLEERQLGLQAFLQNLIAHKDITNSEAVRQFLCLDDPPGPFDSLEESRAFCETLEETNHRLQRELNEKQREIESLKRVLEERHIHIRVLEKRAKNGEYLSPESFESPCRISAMGSESCADTQTTTDGQRDMDGEADVHTDQETSPERSCEVQRLLQGHGAYWCTPPVNGSPDLS